VFIIPFLLSVQSEQNRSCASALLYRKAALSYPLCTHCLSCLHFSPALMASRGARVTGAPRDTTRATRSCMDSCFRSDSSQSSTRRPHGSAQAGLFRHLSINECRLLRCLWAQMSLLPLHQMHADAQSVSLNAMWRAQGDCAAEMGAVAK
jgi:hypothetical protein